MFAVGIRYLMGWAMATDPTDRMRPEWPPHPDRVFMALAAAHFETNGGAAERDALLWLEQQAPPAMWAAPATTRKTVSTWVPVNDKPSSPANCLRRERQFPVAIPNDPTVYLVWPAEPPLEVRDAAETLCGKVARIGHSASLVQAWVEDTPPAPNLVPGGVLGRHWLRVSGRGRLDHLAAQYEGGRRPERSRWLAYDEPPPSRTPPEPHGVFDSRLLVLRWVGGDHLGLESTLLLTETLRRTVIEKCPEPAPEWVSGHNPDGRPSQHPHLAFLPLAHVGSEHADGHLLGVALAVPRGIHPREAGRCLNPVLGLAKDGTLGRLHLYDGGRFEWWLELERRENPPVALRDWVWTRPARRWATVTPLVFDRHPKGQDREYQEQAIVAGACERIGLPRPVHVVLGQVSLHVGAPHRRGFPHLLRKGDDGRLHQAHAVVTFAEPVRGPVLLGAGRYRGYGLCRPVEREEGE